MANGATPEIVLTGFVRRSPFNNFILFCGKEIRI